MAKPKVFNPWDEAQWEPADAAAIQALFRGEASKDQQIRAMSFIVNDVCAARHWGFDPTSQRNTDMVLGKQKVAHTLVMLKSLNVSKLVSKGAPTEQP